jgi:hypothetical protein
LWYAKLNKYSRQQQAAFIGCLKINLFHLKLKDMTTILEYLAYCTPVVFVVLSRVYKLKFNKLQGTGKIPDIQGAKQRQTLFSVLAILSALLIIVIQSEFFFQS